MPGTADLDAEDAKLITLARAARARVGSSEAAAVRDRDGRTYVGAAVSLPFLELTAVQSVVAVAAASGQTTLEAVAVVGTAAALSDPDRRLLDDVSVTTILLAAPDGTLHSRG